MPSAPLRKLVLGGCLWGLMAGCAAGIPSHLAEQVSQNLNLIDIRQHPEAYRGRIIALGGIVTHVEAADKGYRVIVRARDEITLTD